MALVAAASGKRCVGALPGVATPRRSVSRPPLTTEQATSGPSTASTRSSMRPSSSRTGRPAPASRWMPGGVTVTASREPTMSLLVSVSRSPFRSVSAPSRSGPVRYLAPGASTMTPTGTPRRAEAARTSAAARACSSSVPCDMLSRATLMPPRTIASTTPSEAVDGPRVQTIFVLGRVEGIAGFPGFKAG